MAAFERATTGAERDRPPGRRGETHVTAARVFVLAALSGAAVVASAQPSGKAVYETACLACHGADGAGGMPGAPDLAALRERLKLRDATVFVRVRDGYQSAGSPLAMPPRGGNPSLTDAELKAAIDYMRQAFAR